MNLHPDLIAALGAQRETEIRARAEQYRMPPRRELRRLTTRPASHGR